MSLILLLVALIITYTFIKAYTNTKQVVFNKLDIEHTNKDGNKTGQPLQILHLSDLHLENISITPATLYEKLKDEPIDLIALTGDFLDRKRTIPKLLPYLQVLNKLNSSYGMYAVLGNHDYVLRKEHLAELKRVLEAYNCVVLHNENRLVNMGGYPVNIIGIDDYSTNRSDIAEAYKGIEAGYRLVLTHDPNVVLEMKDYDFDYLLSGHFHGGQILYPKAYHLVKMGKLVRMNMIKGLQKYHGKNFYISEGLGQTGLNVRLGSRPEMTLHRIPASEEFINEQVV
ncbi:metallophosphoesterase [Sediminibacillus albus]|uniref:Calcineurin-like phosphoesterase domain-containing protein n=1 Tax=Sediminibacillus albus TaxID=407036 RepID=A0A1G8WYS9_9BACI|nr:metallophosphoesterase [Sediminibacillus albus]SDJ82690.1 hypothetical protein SAMN05216243_1036 [Sediminibacillus albus]